MVEMDAELKKDFTDVSYIFISSVSQYGLQKLKDRLWVLLND
jgi:GTP-binding protein